MKHVLDGIFNTGLTYRNQKKNGQFKFSLTAPKYDSCNAMLNRLTTNEQGETIKTSFYDLLTIMRNETLYDSKYAEDIENVKLMLTYVQTFVNGLFNTDAIHNVNNEHLYDVAHNLHGVCSSMNSKYFYSQLKTVKDVTNRGFSVVGRMVQPRKMSPQGLQFNKREMYFQLKNLVDGNKCSSALVNICNQLLNLLLSICTNMFNELSFDKQKQVMTLCQNIQMALEAISPAEVQQGGRTKRRRQKRRQQMKTHK